MILGFDIGNTNIVVALFADTDTTKPVDDRAAILHQWRIATDSRRTGDEYFTIVLTLLREGNVDLSEICGSVLSSVVPSLTGPFITVSQKLIGKKPLIVTAELFPLLPIRMHDDSSHQIGTDLICDALEGWIRFKSAVIVVDFGTALTFTAVGDDAQIKGIIITPGLGTAMKALTSNTAQLPQIPLVAPPKVLGTNTVNAMQSGIVYGYKGLVESMIVQIKNEMAERHGCDKDKIHVIATGGLNSVLQPITDCFEVYDESLTLNGLRHVLLYYRKSLEE